MSIRVYSWLTSNFNRKRGSNWPRFCASDNPPSPRLRRAGTPVTRPVLIGNVRQIHRDCVCDNISSTRSRGELGGSAEICLCNSGRRKRSAPRSFLSRTADCDSALRSRFPNRDTRDAILLHATRFVVGQREIARANAPAHAAVCDQPRHAPSPAVGFSATRSQ